MTRIATVDMDGSQDNALRAGALIEVAAHQGADFVVLPELAGCPWLPAREEPELRSVAETDEGPSLQALREHAARHSINVVAGLYETDGTGYYSTAYVIARDGQVIGKYRKNHIPYQPGWYEQFYYGPGDSGYPVFEHEGLRFGIQICWDNMFPEGTRILALKGAQVIFSPRATGRGSLARWRAVLQANATVNHVYVATSNRVGEDRTTVFGGGALIVDPFGTVVAEASGPAGARIALANVDPAVVAAAQEAEPFFANRRPEIYVEITRR